MAAHDAVAEEAARISAALADGSEEEREAAYASLEGSVRSVVDSRSGGGREAEQAVALAVACVKALVTSVLCAPASQVGVAEWQRSSLLLAEMAKLDIAVCGEMWQLDDAGTPVLCTVWTAPDSIFAAMLAREPSEWSREDVITAAANCACWMAAWVNGGSAVLAQSGTDEMTWLGAWFAVAPWSNPTPPTRFTALGLLCLDLARAPDGLPEGVVAGAWHVINLIAACCDAPVSKSIWEGGLLEVATSALQHYNPMERVSRRQLIPAAILDATKNTVIKASSIGVEVIQPLLDAGFVDMAISTFTAYQMLGDPSEANVVTVMMGGLMTFEYMDLSSEQAKPYVAKLRSSGAAAFRFLLDNPLAHMAALGQETGLTATKVAAVVWGRDEDGGGLTFKQEDVDKVVQAADHRGDTSSLIGLQTHHCQAILSLTVSDANKELLLLADGFIRILVDSLLLDPEHPRRTQQAVLAATDFADVKDPVQRVSDSVLA